MHRFCRLFAFLGCLALIGSAQPQANPVSQTPTATTEIALGQSVFPLYGPWKFTVGDSPTDSATHKPLWAEPAFDDSKWETVDLKSKAGAFDPITGASGYVPGWASRGHSGYWGYAWYRIRIHVAAQTGEDLALAGPTGVDDAYQLFSDGTLIGSFGKFAGSRPTIYYTRPMMFNLPTPSSGSVQAPPGSGFRFGSPSSSPFRVLVFRVWMAPSTLLVQADAGGLHTVPLLGNANAVSAVYRLRWLELVRTYSTNVIEGLLYLLLAVVAFSLARFDRSDSVYVWMGSVFLLRVAFELVFILAVWTQSLGAVLCSALNQAVLGPLLFGGWVMVWRIWFHLQRPAWIPKVIALLTLGYMLSRAIGEDLFYPLIPVPVGGAFHTVSLGVRLALLALLVLIVTWGIRRHGAEGWLVLPAVMLITISQFQQELARLGVRLNWFPFGVTLGLGQLATLLQTAVMFALLLRRLMLSVRKQRLLALDVKQAQEVQRVILPEAITTLPGLTIENEYRPAREVGGDFYQILPHSSDGSLLIVAGDVAGKGLQAGMLVALLVGAIRSTAEMNPDPLFVLEALNRRLVGRSEAHATCLAMCIGVDGAVRLANAGHLPPYLNGQSVAMEGALPLGVLEDADFPVSHFQLKDDDRLVLASDGIVEAMDEHRQLFGFARLQKMLQTRVSAAELANAAQDFGQDDDISVIAVTWRAALVPA